MSPRRPRTLAVGSIYRVNGADYQLTRFRPELDPPAAQCAHVVHYPLAPEVLEVVIIPTALLVESRELYNYDTSTARTTWEAFDAWRRKHGDEGSPQAPGVQP